MRASLLALGAAVFIVNLDARAVAPLLTAIARELHLSIGRVGWLVSGYMLPYGVFQLAYGPLADRLGKLRVAAAALFVFGVGTALCGVGHSFALMLTYRVLTGAAAAALFPLALAFIGDAVPYERRQATIAILMASAGAAQAFGASAGGLIAAVVSWRMVFPIIGVAAVVAAVALSIQAHRAEPPRTRPVGGALAGYIVALRARGFARLLVLVSVEGFLFIGGFSFLSPLVEHRFGYGPLGSGLLLALAGAAQLAAARVLPRIVRRVGEVALVGTGGVVMGFAYLLAAVAPNAALVGVACALLGAGFTLCHSTFQTRATEAVPQARATAVALFAFSLFLGSGAGAALYAVSIDLVGFAWTFGTAGFLLFAFTAVALRAIRQPR